MTDNHLTPAYLSEILKASYYICIEKTYSGFLDETTIKLLKIYQRLNKFQGMMPQKVYIIDNDETLGHPIGEKGAIKYNSVNSLPYTHENMKWLISKFYDPNVLAFIATGRKMYDHEYDSSDPNIMAKMIAKQHNIEQFIDRVWTNNLNDHHPTNWTDRISNEVHKAI